MCRSGGENRKLSSFLMKNKLHHKILIELLTRAYRLLLSKKCCFLHLESIISYHTLLASTVFVKSEVVIYFCSPKM